MQLTEFKAAGGNILTLEVRAEIRQTRFKAICRDLDKATAVLGKIRLVLVMRHYPSFNSAEDFYDDLRFLRLYDHSIERVAVVCDRFWKETWVALFGLFAGIRIENFDRPEFNDAWKWISENA